MELTLKRLWQTGLTTIGQLGIDGVYECYTLEPAKPIPAGRYQVTPYDSPDHHEVVPFVNHVPGHTYVEIHVGNTTEDTKGCILVGKTTKENSIGASRVAFTELMAKLTPIWFHDGEVWLVIEDPPRSNSGAVTG